MDLMDTIVKAKKAAEQIKNKVMNISDVEAKVLDATNTDPWGPSATQMNEIAQFTFRFHEYDDVMNTIFKRFKESTNWRNIYKSMTLLEHLIRNGSERVISDTRGQIYVIKSLRTFQYRDETGKDCGINVRERSKKLVQFVGDDSQIRMEREKAKTNRDKYAGYSRDDMGRGGSGFGSQSSQGFGPSGNKYGGFGRDDYVDRRSDPEPERAVRKPTPQADSGSDSESSGSESDSDERPYPTTGGMVVKIKPKSEQATSAVPTLSRPGVAPPIAAAKAPPAAVPPVSDFTQDLIGSPTSFWGAAAAAADPFAGFDPRAGAAPPAAAPATQTAPTDAWAAFPESSADFSQAPVQTQPNPAPAADSFFDDFQQAVSVTPQAQPVQPPVAQAAVAPPAMAPVDLLLPSNAGTTAAPPPAKTAAASVAAPAAPADPKDPWAKAMAGGLINLSGDGLKAKKQAVQPSGRQAGSNIMLGMSKNAPLNLGTNSPQKAGGMPGGMGMGMGMGSASAPMNPMQMGGGGGMPMAGPGGGGFGGPAPMGMGNQQPMMGMGGGMGMMGGGMAGHPQHQQHQAGQQQFGGAGGLWQ